LDDAAIKIQSLEEYSSETRVRLERSLNKNPYAENHEIHGMSNDEYRKTSLWKKIRLWVRTRDDFSCQTCSKKGNTKYRPLDVHHRAYDKDTLEGRTPSNLISLCRECHDKIEYFEPEKINKRECEKQKEIVLKKMLEAYSVLQRRNKENAQKLLGLGNELELLLGESIVRGAKHYSISAGTIKDISIEVNLTNFGSSFYLFLCRNIGGSTIRAIRNYSPLSNAVESGNELKIYCETSKKLLLKLSLTTPRNIKIKLTKSTRIDFEELLNDFVRDFSAEKCIYFK
jgi:5-methylcytosine-specific restriction protein A